MTIEEAFVKYKEIYDFANIGVNLEDIVNVDELIKTPVTVSLDSGVAYDGALIFHTIMIWHFANKLLPIYEKIDKINVKSLAKVTVLHQLGKIGMFTPNQDEWQVKKLGKVYSFVENNVCMKTGELSKMVCSNAGVKFTIDEYEAMSILDKSNEDFEKSNKYHSHLSTIFKMASDLAYSLQRERYNLSKTNI